MSIKKYKQFINVSEGSSSFAYSDRKDIEYFCRKNDVFNYTITEDGLLDVHGNVDLSRNKLTKLPLRFGEVTGYFKCVYNRLTSLEGCPHTVGSDFDCSDNNLVSLEYGPKKFGGEYYDCKNNELVSFEGFPELFRKGLVFDCKDNPVQEVYHLFDKSDAIPMINDWELINVEEMTVSFTRLMEIHKELGWTVKPDNEFYVNKKYFDEQCEYYKLVD